ncbi:hypothetical protein ACVIGB_008363 [Bradyrhizobium sp. USDA 4341]
MTLPMMMLMILTPIALLMLLVIMAMIGMTIMVIPAWSLSPRPSGTELLSTPQGFAPRPSAGPDRPRPAW